MSNAFEPQFELVGAGRVGFRILSEQESKLLPQNLRVAAGDEVLSLRVFALEFRVVAPENVEVANALLQEVHEVLVGELH